MNSGARRRVSRKNNAPLSALFADRQWRGYFNEVLVVIEKQKNAKYKVKMRFHTRAPGKREKQKPCLLCPTMFQLIFG